MWQRAMLVLAALLSLCGICSASVMADYNVLFEVNDANTGEAVSNATVAIVGTSTDLEGVTSDTGQTAAYLPSGTYTLIINKTQYTILSKTIYISGDTTYPLKLVPTTGLIPTPTDIETPFSMDFLFIAIIMALVAGMVLVTLISNRPSKFKRGRYGKVTVTSAIMSVIFLIGAAVAMSGCITISNPNPTGGTLVAGLNSWLYTEVPVQLHIHADPRQVNKINDATWEYRSAYTVTIKPANTADGNSPPASVRQTNEIQGTESNPQVCNGNAYCSDSDIIQSSAVAHPSVDLTMDTGRASILTLGSGATSLSIPSGTLIEFLDGSTSTLSDPMMLSFSSPRDLAFFDNLATLRILSSCILFASGLSSISLSNGDTLLAPSGNYFRGGLLGGIGAAAGGRAFILLGNGLSGAIGDIADKHFYLPVFVWVTVTINTVQGQVASWDITRAWATVNLPRPGEAYDKTTPMMLKVYCPLYLKAKQTINVQVKGGMATGEGFYTSKHSDDTGLILSAAVASLLIAGAAYWAWTSGIPLVNVIAAAIIAIVICIAAIYLWWISSSGSGSVYIPKIGMSNIAFSNIDSKDWNYKAIA